MLSQIIITHLNLPEAQSLLKQFLLLVFLLGGFSLLSWTSTRSGKVRVVNALPVRATSRQEWLRGAALGWGMLLVAVLPMMLAGDLHPQPWMQPRAWIIALISLAALVVASLTLEVAFRGYLYSRLIAAIKPVPATAVMALIYAVGFSFYENATVWSTLAAFLMGILLSIAYLRTHALWLGWGLHFAWLASMCLIFGLPVPGYPNLSSLVATDVSGRTWFTGGAYGPEAAVFTLVVLLLAIPVLYRITRDYAWDYTHAPIIPAAYAVVIAPPAAHTAMEDAAPAPLVQILGSTSTSASTLPVIEEHLRSTSADRGESN